MKCPNCVQKLVEDPAFPGRHECSSCGFNYYPNTKKIDDFYVWLSVDPENGREGLVAFYEPRTDTNMVACSSDLKLCLKMKENMRRAEKTTGLKFHLVQYMRVKIIDTT